MACLYCPAVPQGFFFCKKLHACFAGKGLYMITKVYDNGVYLMKWNLPPHKQQVVHFDRLKPYLNRQEEQRPTVDQATMSEKTNEEVEDMYDDMSIQNGLGDEAITVVQHDNNVSISKQCSSTARDHGE